MRLISRAGGATKAAPPMREAFRSWSWSFPDQAELGHDLNQVEVQTCVGDRVGLPLLAAASVSVAALVWGGAFVGAVVAVVALSVVLLRRRSSAGACPMSDEPRAPRVTRVSKEVAKWSRSEVRS